MHDYHDALPGYSPKQILFDGCAECERRGRDVPYAIAMLDPDNFLRAWTRAVDYFRLTDMSGAETELLRTLHVVGRQFAVSGVPFIAEEPDMGQGARS